METVLTVGYGLMETAVLVFFGLSLLNHPWKWPRAYVLVAAIFTVVAVMRSLSVAFGLHSVFLILLLGMGLALVTGHSLPKTMSAAAIAVVLLLVLEFVFIKAASVMFDFQPSEALENFGWWLLLGTLHCVALLILSYLVRLGKFRLLLRRVGL